MTMNEEKQIEEMARTICNGCCVDHKHCGFISNHKLCPTALSDAENLYNANYRKQSDVAKEIFAALKERVQSGGDCEYNYDYVDLADIEELESLYIKK